MGISTVFLSLETIVGEFGATYLREEFDKLMEEKGVEVYSVLTHYNDGEVRRQMLLYSKNLDKLSGLASALEGAEVLNLSHLELDGMDHPDLKVY